MGPLRLDWPHYPVPSTLCRGEFIWAQLQSYFLLEWKHWNFWLHSSLNCQPDPTLLPTGLSFSTRLNSLPDSTPYQPYLSTRFYSLLDSHLGVVCPVYIVWSRTHGCLFWTNQHQALGTPAETEPISCKCWLFRPFYVEQPPSPLSQVQCHPTPLP